MHCVLSAVCVLLSCRVLMADMAARSEAERVAVAAEDCVGGPAGCGEATSPGRQRHNRVRVTDSLEHRHRQREQYATQAQIGEPEVE